MSTTTSGVRTRRNPRAKKVDPNQIFDDWEPLDDASLSMQVNGFLGRDQHWLRSSFGAAPEYKRLRRNPRLGISLDLSIDVIHKLDDLVAHRRNKWGYASSSRRKVIEEAMREFFASKYPNAKNET